jgi:hypothetical protein
VLGGSIARVGEVAAPRQQAGDRYVFVDFVPVQAGGADLNT